MNIQIGESATADFEENTWTFEMTESLMKIKAGKFAIIPIDFWDEIKEVMQDSRDVLLLNTLIDKSSTTAEAFNKAENIINKIRA